MVNANRVKRKLPSLLIDGATTDKRQWAERARISYRLSRFRKRNPQKYYTLNNRLITVLECFEREVCKKE